MKSDMHERMSAYIDGTLDEADAIALEAEMASSPDLARQLAQMRASDKALRSVFGAQMHDRVAGRRAAPPPDLKGADVLDFAAARAKRDSAKPVLARRDWRAYATLAGTLVAGALFLGAPGPLSRQEEIQAALARIFDHSASGQKVTLAGGMTITPRFSFAAKDGRYCREFASDGQAGIACRSAGGWTVEALASDDGRKGKIGTSAALDQDYARLGTGDAFDAPHEKALIANGWMPRQKP
jgi:hypothetical protein